jgi:hypothetical protein
MGKSARIRRERREGRRESPERKAARRLIVGNLNRARVAGLRYSRMLFTYTEHIVGTRAVCAADLFHDMALTERLVEEIHDAALAENENRDHAAEWGVKV